jgi:hypothetical protein
MSFLNIFVYMMQDDIWFACNEPQPLCSTSSVRHSSRYATHRTLEVDELEKAINMLAKYKESYSTTGTYLVGR